MPNSRVSLFIAGLVLALTATAWIVPGEVQAASASCSSFQYGTAVGGSGAYYLSGGYNSGVNSVGFCTSACEYAAINGTGSQAAGNLTCSDAVSNINSTNPGSYGCSAIYGATNSAYLGYNGSYLSNCTYNGTPVVTPSVSPSTIYSGQSSILSWSATNTSSCTVTDGSGNTVGSGGASGSLTLSPVQTTTYSVSCTGGGGSTGAGSATINVIVPSTSYCSAMQPGYETGGTENLIPGWNVAVNQGPGACQAACQSYSQSNRESIVCTSQEEIANGGTAGVYYTCQVMPGGSSNVVYTNNALSQNSNANPSGFWGGAAITQNDYVGTCTYTPPAPTVTLSASPTSIVDGNSSTLTWTATNATSCTLTDGSGNTVGSGIPGGSVSVSPTTTTNYSVTCNDGGFTATATASVTVTYQANLISITGPAVTTNANQAVSLTGTVSNTGTAAASNFPNVIQVCDAGCTNINTILSATQIASLSAGASAPISASYTPAVANSLYYRSCANENSSWSTGAGGLSNCGNWQYLTVNPAIPPAPTNPVTTCSPSGTSVSFSWTPAPGATNYYPRMYAPTASQCTSFGWQVWTADNQTCYPNPDDWTATNVVNFPITPGQNYAWYVASGNSGGVNWNATTGNWSFSCTAPPDLIAATGPVVTDSVNQPITLTGTATNIGAGPAGAFPNLIQVCDWNGSGCPTVNTLVVANQISSLGASASSPVAASYTPTAAGALSYRVCSDEVPTANSNFTAAITESNYGNNCGAWSTLTVENPISASCSASPTVIPVGGSSTWSASASGGSGGYTYSWSGNVSGSAQSVSQTYPQPGTYSGAVTVTDSTGNHTNVSCSNDPISVISCTPAFSANPTTITQGQSSALSWSEDSRCASSCSGTGFNTAGALSGTMSVSPSTTSSYSLSCGAQPAVNQTVTVIVPSVTLTASPSRVAKGGHTALSWTSNNTNTCTVMGNGSTIGTGTTGSNVADPNPINEQATYTATCTTNGNPVSSTAVVNIVPQFQEF